MTEHELNLPAVAESQFLVLRRAEEVREIVTRNLAGGGIGGPFGLERIKVPTGGGLFWQVPTLDGVEAAKSFEGVLIYQKPGRQFWAVAFDQRSETTPPDCVSDNMEHGVGDPGGLCRDCQYNQWGSHPKSKGKACRETRMLFILRPEEVIPTLVVAPPTSLQSVQAYLLRLTSRIIAYEGVVTTFGLEEDTNDAGIKYAKMTLKVARQLEDQEARAMRILSDYYAPHLATVRVTATDLDEAQS